jgi:hypothetical protein
MEPMTAYDVAKRITEERGWPWTPQFFDGQIRLLVPAEQRWLGVTTSPYDDVVLLHAGNILPGGTPTAPLAETSAQSSDLDALLRELERLWQRLGGNDAKHL